MIKNVVHFQTGDWESYFQPNDEEVQLINKISKLGKDSSQHEWESCLDELSDVGYSRYLCNDKELGRFPSKRWTFQHHAAFYQAPECVVKKMLKENFEMTYKDSEGKIPKDHVPAGASEDYKALFNYQFKLENLKKEKIDKIEQQFHATILSRCEKLVEKHHLILPILSVILEGECENPVYCAIPGMYGGFTFRFVKSKDKTDVEYLETDSWCRVAGGSGQRHKCTESSFELIEEGFC